MMKKTIFTTIILGMSILAVGCGKNDIDTDIPQSEVIETMATIESSEIEETPSVVAEYEVINLQVPYVVMINTDTFLIDNPNTAGKIVDLAKDSRVKIIGNVIYEGIEVDYYYVELEDGKKGFVDGSFINFNSLIESDIVEEIPDGDGENVESTETETESISEVATESIETQANVESSPANGVLNIDACEPTLKYANTNANIRAIPDKEGDLVATVSLNTEITVIGTVDNWSQIEHNGVVCYIKSSLLSDSKIEVVQNTAPESSTVVQQTIPQKETDSRADITEEDLDKALAELGFTTDAEVVYGNGNTGATTDGSYGSAY